MIYLNGSYLPEQNAKIECSDRGFLLGDGIFETLRVYNGIVSCLSDHYTRLKQSANYLGLPFTLLLSEIEDIISTLLVMNKLDQDDATLRITLSRGIGPRGLLPPNKTKVTCMMTVFPFLKKEVRPLDTLIANIRRNELSPLSNIKSLCYLDNIMARQFAEQRGADECIMLNTQGRVACASAANIFIVARKGIITPPLDEGVLPGITRKIILKLCEINDIPVFEEKIFVTDLMEAKEIFFTNRLIEIQPVKKVNNKLINKGGTGEFTLKIQDKYKNYIEKFLR